MTAEEFYEKEFGNADSIPKKSVLRLLKNFARALKLEREQALRIHDVEGQNEQLCECKELRLNYVTDKLHCVKCGKEDKR